MGKKLQFTELDQYLFGQGTNYDIYRKLGAHPDTQNRKKGVYFAVWAPNAQAVSVIGEFNEWDTEKNPMKKVGPIGVYETFVPGAKIGQLYKFYITGAHGEELYKADPYANAAEMRPGTASRVTDITNYKWKDDTWMKNREAFDPDTSAMSIYEVHPGSWMKHPQTAEDESWPRSLPGMSRKWVTHMLSLWASQSILLTVPGVIRLPAIMHRPPVTEHHRISNIWLIISIARRLVLSLTGYRRTSRRMHTDLPTLTELQYTSMQIRDRASIRTGEPRSTITDVRK